MIMGKSKRTMEMNDYITYVFYESWIVKTTIHKNIKGTVILKPEVRFALANIKKKQKKNITGTHESVREMLTCLDDFGIIKFF